MKNGFVKVSACVPDLKVSDVKFNTEKIIDLIRKAYNDSVKVTVFPELSLTGSTCGDLFFQASLLEEVKKGISLVLEKTKRMKMLIALGAPLSFGGRLYNCAVVMCEGEILGIIPKTYLNNSDKRYFNSSSDENKTVSFLNKEVSFGNKLLFNCDNMDPLKVGFEIGEDCVSPYPVSTDLACAGATVICNLASQNALVSGDERRKELLSSLSNRLVCGYVSASSGKGESTTDLVFSGFSFVYENGRLLCENKPFDNGNTVTEIDVEKLEGERRRKGVFADFEVKGFEEISFSLKLDDTKFTRKIEKSPFIPTCKVERAKRCEEILNIQANGLRKRFEHTNSKCAVIGISGGLDSCLALLVACKTFDIMGMDRKDIVAVTMPCFGTTGRTRGNAEILCKELGVTFREINIKKAVTQHFEDIGQGADTFDVTFENGQARERTQVLMDVSNMLGGLVIGTGDLSELALGWATYNGDHMSMYGVNASVPKTLVRHLVSYCAEVSENEKLKSVLFDILDTPVSPELLPTDNGNIAQKTENIVGPYELHDFFLYYTVRWGFSPQKILSLAKYAFEGEYDEETILKWLKIFIRRFFNQQFKRSCLPDGPKVGTVSLSPRGDFMMPSDACSTAWLESFEDQV